jgi:hypothetical protein
VDVFKPPTKYRQFQDVFWMRPCTGQQFIKGTVFRQNTPAVETGGREYFQAVKRDRLWSMSPAAAGVPILAAPSEKFFVDTASSITTGEFFAALSIESALKVDGASESADCTAEEAQRVAAAMTGRPDSFNHPILAPGVGFAVINESGRVLFHSDERRAVYENLFDDEGLANRLRAVLATRSDASFHAHYQTSPHQVYVHPLRDIPWAIVTFADDEILRTEHIETLAESAVLIGLYLLLAVLGTLLYIFLHGREPPQWVWPCRDAKYRVLYANAVWTLCAQLILSLLALDVLRGEVLALACVLLPLPAVCTIIIAARQARRLRAPPKAGVAADIYYAEVAREFRRSVAWLLALAVGLLIGLIALMKFCYPLAAAQIDTGIATAGIVVLLVIVIASGAFGERLNGLRFPLTQWWRDPLTPHIVASVIVWLVVGALPAYGLYKFVHANQMTVMTMNEHAYVERAFAWRGCKVQDEHRSIPNAESTARQRELAGARSSSSNDGPLFMYVSALMSRDALVDADQQSYENVSDRAVGHEFWEYLANRAPVYNQTTLYSRYFEFVAPATQSGFKWITAGGKDSKAIGEPMLVYQHIDERSCDRAVHSVASRPPMLEPHFGLLGTLGVLVLLPILFGWSAFGARRLFFGDIEIEARRTRATEDGLPPVVHPGRLDLPSDPAWIKTEVAAIFDPSLDISEEMLNALCERSTTRRAVAEAILQQAWAFYTAEWQKCSDEEKLLLIQLVQEGFANPRQHEAVRRLLKRGLMRRDPVLRPMNDSFALFIENETEPEDVRHMETVHRGMRWTLVRNVLIAAGLLVLIFLSVTQRDVIEVWAAYLGTAVAGAGGVLKLFSMLGRSGSQKSS